MSSTSEQRSELRLRVRTTLDHLETKDLCNQSSIGLQRICDRCTNPADLALVLKESLSGLACASAQARRVRYKYLKHWSISGTLTDAVLCNFRQSAVFVGLLQQL